MFNCINVGGKAGTTKDLKKKFLIVLPLDRLLKWLFEIVSILHVLSLLHCCQCWGGRFFWLEEYVCTHPNVCFVCECVRLCACVCVKLVPNVGEKTLWMSNAIRCGLGVVCECAHCNFAASLYYTDIKCAAMDYLNIRPALVADRAHWSNSRPAGSFFP